MEALQAFLTRLGEDAGFRASFYADPEAVLQHTALDDTQKAAIIHQDTAALAALSGDDSWPYLMVNHGNKM